MSKYIKLEEAIETVYQCRRAEANDEWIKRWLEPLTSLPTIDIVRCGECENVGTEDCPMGEVYRDDFCCWGIRRKDGQ